jgi:hypothetical protein
MQLYFDDIPEITEGSTKDEYIAFLISLAVPELTKKYMYIQWCEEHGEYLTRDDIEKFYQHPPG